MDRQDWEHERREEQEEKRIARALEKISVDLHDLTEFVRAAKSLEITQIGGNMGVITGIKAGATGTFALSTLPAGSLLQSGSIPTYSSDNTVDVSAIVPAADGLSFSVTAAAAPVAKSFNVTASAVSLSGTALSKAFNIPLLASAGVPATDLDLNQLS